MRSTSVTSTSARRSARAAASPPKPPPTITTRRLPAVPLSRHGRTPAGRLRAQPLEQVVADAQRVGHRGQRRVHRADAREEAGVDDVEVVELVRLAVDVEHRGRGIGAEAAGAGLVGARRRPGSRSSGRRARGSGGPGACRGCRAST